jgi:hypothetical protein
VQCQQPHEPSCGERPCGCKAAPSSMVCLIFLGEVTLEHPRYQNIQFLDDYRDRRVSSVSFQRFCNGRLSDTASNVPEGRHPHTLVSSYWDVADHCGMNVVQAVRGTSTFRCFRRKCMFGGQEKSLILGLRTNVYRRLKGNCNVLWPSALGDAASA